MSFDYVFPFNFMLEFYVFFGIISTRVGANNYFIIGNWCSKLPCAVIKVSLFFNYRVSDICFIPFTRDYFTTVVDTWESVCLGRVLRCSCCNGSLMLPNPVIILHKECNCVKKCKKYLNVIYGPIFTILFPNLSSFALPKNAARRVTSSQPLTQPLDTDH